MLASGLTILLTAAHVIIPGTISVAYYFRIPAHVLAVLLIAAGTSAPELIVAIKAGLNGTPQIVWGNIGLKHYQYLSGLKHLWFVFSDQHN